MATASGMAPRRSEHELLGFAAAASDRGASTGVWWGLRRRRQAEVRASGQLGRSWTAHLKEIQRTRSAAPPLKEIQGPPSAATPLKEIQGPPTAGPHLQEIQGPPSVGPAHLSQAGLSLACVRSRVAAPITGAGLSPVQRRRAEIGHRAPRRWRAQLGDPPAPAASTAAWKQLSVGTAVAPSKAARAAVPGRSPRRRRSPAWGRPSRRQRAPHGPLSIGADRRPWKKMAGTMHAGSDRRDGS